MIKITHKWHAGLTVCAETDRVLSVTEAAHAQHIYPQRIWFEGEPFLAESSEGDEVSMINRDGVHVYFKINDAPVA